MGIEADAWEGRELRRVRAQGAGGGFVRFAARRDPPHASIRDGLRRVPDCSVYDSSWIGGGFADLCVMYGSTFRMYEIKDPAAPPSRQKLNDKQKKIAAMFAPVYRVIMSLDDALEDLGIAVLTRPR
jgi:hypothetical protein